MRKNVSLTETIVSLWDKAKGIFLDIWENAGKDDDIQGLISQQLQARIFIVIMLVAVGLLFMYLLVTFIRAPWKEKVRRLATLVIAVGVVAAIVAAALYFSGDLGA